MACVTMLRLPLLALAIGCLGCRPEAATRGPTPLVIGHTWSIDSKVLSDVRAIHVAEPPGHSAGAEPLDVLYVIDGGPAQDLLHIHGTAVLGAIWGRSRPVLVVGIETENRKQELVTTPTDPATRAQFPLGRAAQFRAFIRDEVKPLVAANYRITDQDAVIGESLAGLFILESYVDEPTLFDHYAAISPSLWFDDAALSGRAASVLSARPADGHRLYLAAADEGGAMQAAIDRFVEALTQRTGWCYAPRSDLTHATIYHALSPAALQFVLPAATPTDFDVGCVARH